MFVFSFSNIYKRSVMPEPQYLADQLTLFQPGKGRLSPLITTGTPKFFHFQFHWRDNSIQKDSTDFRPWKMTMTIRTFQSLIAIVDNLLLIYEKVKIHFDQW
jgi:hypothetical protein